jgi:apolipoprotein N-acyltransferase
MHAVIKEPVSPFAFWSRFFSRIRTETPSAASAGIALSSAVLLTAAFPDFDLWPLAWIALIPLLLTIARRPLPVRSFLLGWLTGSVFFYCSCYWLTFSMINYGGLNPVVAYLLLVPGALTVGIFPGFFAAFVSVALRRFGKKGLLLAPFIWPALEWARLSLTGQLWNALGYSQAYQPYLIQMAKWGGVYAVSFLIVVVNAAVALVLLVRSKQALLIASTIIVFAIGAILLSNRSSQTSQLQDPAIRILALQPNVPMTIVKSADEMRQLTERHLTRSLELLRQSPDDGVPRLLIWPESPMNFEYARNADFQTLVSVFAREHRTALLFNSQEPAPNNGIYNSAILVNEQGKLVGQYDKIRLLPFGEYVPLPRWLPGASLITAIVGDFTPGANYTLFQVGELKAGVFICVESAYPSIARAFTQAGADVLINVSNDGYLGRTAVMRQHLANAVFRAVENGRPVVRVTNSGITAFIDERGDVSGETEAFQEATRSWSIERYESETTLYTRHGDLFVLVITVMSVLLFLIPLMKPRMKFAE